MAFVIAVTLTNVSANGSPLVSVNHLNNTYTTTLNTTINAKQDAIFSILTTHNHLDRFSRLIENSQLLANGDLRLKLVACFTFICFNKQQTLKLTISDASIFGRIIPATSDFKSGWMEWKISEANGHTSIYFSSELTPNFWVPPFIGPLLIQYKLENEALYSIYQLEKLSRINKK